MIKMINAYTTEIDDVNAALAEILEKLDSNGLLKNSVGLLTCYNEFIETNIVEDLCQRLPFDVIGCTTLANALSAEHGMYMLQLAVFTSDDVSFSTALSKPLSLDNYGDEIKIAYDEARSALPGDPSFIISFFPFLPELSGAYLLESFDRACGGAPIFGMVASDTTMAIENAKVIYNGKSEKCSAVMLLLHGDNINPQFIKTSLPERNIRKQKAIITESDGCILKRVNDMPLTDYLNGVGIKLVEDIAANALVIPLMVDYGNGEESVAVAVYHIGEDGTAVCGAEVPCGASFSIGEIDRNGIIETALATLEKVLEGEYADCLVMFPCITRYHMLSPNYEDEIKTVKGLMEDKMPFALAYAGGEICPVYDETGKTHNRFHNYTFIACIF